MSIKSVSIRIDEEMLNKLHVVADYEGRSLNSQVLILIRESIAAYEERHGKIGKDWKKSPDGALFLCPLGGEVLLEKQGKEAWKGEQFGEKGVNITAVEKSVETVKNPLFKGISEVAARLWISP